MHSMDDCKRKRIGSHGRRPSFIWMPQEASESTTCDPPSSQPVQAKIKPNTKGSSKHEKSKTVANTQPMLIEPISQPNFSSETVISLLASSEWPINGKSMEELRTPLLQSVDIQTSESTAARGAQQSFINDDQKPKRAGRRAKMMDLGKKMGERLEETRYHIEEKGRNIIEKM